MSYLKNILSLLIAAALFSACSNSIVGTWKVAKYESKEANNSISLSDIGTITFNKNNKGEKAISYTILGEQKVDNSPFTWEEANNTVTVKSKDSDFDKIWLVISNKRKAKKLQSTDGTTGVQTLMLVK